MALEVSDAARREEMIAVDCGQSGVEQVTGHDVLPGWTVGGLVVTSRQPSSRQN